MGLKKVYYLVVIFVAIGLPKMLARRNSLRHRRLHVQA